MPGSTKSPQPCDQPLSPASTEFSAAALANMRAAPNWTGAAICLNDMLLTLCLLDHDIRFLTLERISDVVAAGLQLQHDKEEAEFRRAAARRARRSRAQ